MGGPGHSPVEAGHQPAQGRAPGLSMWTYGPSLLEIRLSQYTQTHRHR